MSLRILRCESFLSEREYVRDPRGRFAPSGRKPPQRKPPIGTLRGEKVAMPGQLKVRQPPPFGGKQFPKFTGQGVIGIGPTKMRVLSKKQGQDIFRRAGKRMGYATESYVVFVKGPVAAKFLEGTSNSSNVVRARVILR